MDKDYKKLYEEALERARDLHDNHPLGQPLTWTTCEKIFPELRESEDERIRLSLMSFLNSLSEMEYPSKEEYRKWWTWLEKQGEQEPVDYNEELKKCRENPLYFFDKYVKVKLKEQKPAWSEEDKKIVLSLHHALNCADAQNAVTKTGVEVTDVANWLSNCKERFVRPNHWKPTEEQMNALDKAKNSPANYHDIRLGLQSLYNDLLKL